MIFYFKTCTLMIVLIKQVVSNWRLIDYSFTEVSISENNWKMRDNCDSTSDSSFMKETCDQNQLSYASLSKSRELLLKTFNYKSYQVLVILDVFFGDADGHHDSQIKVMYNSNIASQSDQQLYRRDYKDGDLTQYSIRVCNGTTSTSRFELKTIVSTFGNQNTNTFTIKICVDPDKDYMRIGIRNLLVYVNTCHPTCLTCNGPLVNNCQTCFDAQTLSGGKCTCISNQQFSETFIGCRQECERDYSIARYDKICVEDKRIKSKFTLFENNIPQSNYYRYSPLEFQEDQFHPKNTDLIQENCNGINFVGNLQFSEGMIYKMSLENAVKFLRIRMTFYLFSFQEQSKIEILHNDQIQSKITKDSTNFQFENLISIFQENGNCINSYTLLRIEMIFQIYESQPKLTIQGQLQYDYESWGIRNITVDTGFCQENCLICSDFSNCAQCNTGYKLYKNMCVLSCPIHSSNCVDYEDLIPYSRYLAKGFYDLNMTIDEIDSFYDVATDPTKNYATDQKFSFLKNKIVLGGILVWNDGSYQKTWTFSDPHYAVTVYFNITYGDGYTGQFNYKIGASSTTSWQGPETNPGGGSNYIGRTFLESTSYFNVSLTNFYTNNLYVEFKCDVGTANITKEFCAISEYFIVVHYCRPFCSSCTSLNVCSGTSSSCGGSQYLYYNSTTETYSCKNCIQPGCSTCSSAETCTQCINSQFYLQNGMCLCKPFTFQQANNCVQCNKYCENCYGSSKQNCITCVEDYHRAIQQNQCLCKPGYYDDGINLPCLPICGDLIVVDQEDCDDGNFNPYDGCHNCKFACNFACDICFNGKCYACKNGYELHNNDCRSICQSNTLTLLQQCNENSINCVHCQFKCSIHCIDCQFGICLQCDENAGWYVQIDGTCNSICGDGITVNLTESCDDSNTIPYDGCYRCQFQCDAHCLTCINSQCLQCQIGYQLFENNCYPKCLDQIIVYPEQCEDGNLTQYDGCFNCQFQCSRYCTECQFGICQKCDELNGWYLQLNGTCQSVCGDNITVKEVEECENNTNLNRPCNQCQYACDQNCLECNNGLCSACIKGYQLLQSIQKCVQICHDGSLVQNINICEDYNNLQYDGCYSCQISCQSSCTLCTFYGCQECNKQGWKLNEQSYKCEPICGDGIIIQDIEECDDLVNSNCFQCKYSCQDSCLKCYQGSCLQCQKGWQLDLEKKCNPSSGDSLIVGNEQCDDNNFIMNDGCYLSSFQCQEFCLSCQFGRCFQCQLGFQILNHKCYEILNDGYVLGDEQCDDNNLQAADGCFNGQFDCPEDCEYCYKGLCLKCNQESKQLDQINNYCQSICGDGYLSNDEQCDDANNIPHDGCHQCKFQCNDYCLICTNGECQQCYFGYELDNINNTCISICGDGIVTNDEQCDYRDLQQIEECLNCKLQCQEQCMICVDGECFQCLYPGWELNPIDLKCYPICGDQLVQGNEQCDDGNNDDDDGCVECYFGCQQQCTLCNISDCLQCDVVGWQLNINRCSTICGDKLILGKEECDDGNLIPYDGCHECKYQCQDQCIDCRKGVCNACINRGWVLNSNHICTNNCGDGITIDGYELCDDGNEIPYDGCYQCEFQCELLCTLCDQGICYECNQYGWSIKNNKCTPICGDGIVVGIEQCDDMNSINYDGCYECNFVCDQYCLDCQEGICYQCLQGMHLINQFCQPVCGDGFHLSLFEYCDDGNKESGDGCNSQCKIEKDWICITNQNFFSVCLISKEPDFTMTALTSHPQEFCDVQIQFNQQLKLSPKIQNDLNENMIVSIINSQQENYNIQLIKGTTITHNELTDLVLQFRIFFMSTIENPIFQIEFHNDPIISEYNQTLSRNQGKIELATPTVLGQTEVQIAEQAQSFNQAIIISLASLSSVCLLTGQSDIFWNLMDQLQYLSYVKYVNIDFSPNLNIYFEVFKFVTISPLMSFLGIDKLFAALDGSENYIVITNYKFFKDDINAYFLSNFQSFLFCFLATYLSFYCAQIIHNLLKKIGHIQIQKLGFKIGKLVISARTTLQLKISEFYYNAVLRLLLSNSYDLCFACSIQLAYYPKNSDTVLIINYYLSFVIYIGIVMSILYIINISSNFSKQNTLKNKSRYQAIFDGIKDNNRMWTFQYNSLLLIKKLIFISSIVFLQDDGYIQVIAISFLQSLFLIHLILNKPLDDQFEYFKTLVTEILIILNVVSFLLYQYKNEINLQPEKVIFLGWMHIVSFSLILAVTFILDSTKQIKKLSKFIRQAFKKPEQKHQPIFYGCN